MNDRDIQHPDITAVERTGWPAPVPYRMKLEIDSEVQRAYIDDHRDDFIDWCFADPDIIRHYLEETENRLSGWIKEVLAG